MGLMTGVAALLAVFAGFLFLGWWSPSKPTTESTSPTTTSKGKKKKPKKKSKKAASKASKTQEGGKKAVDVAFESHAASLLADTEPVVYSASEPAWSTVTKRKQTPKAPSANVTKTAVTSIYDVSTRMADSDSSSSDEEQVFHPSDVRAKEVPKPSKRAYMGTAPTLRISAVPSSSPPSQQYREPEGLTKKQRQV